MPTDSTTSLGKRHDIGHNPYINNAQPVWSTSLEEARAKPEASANEIPTAIEYLANHLKNQGLNPSIRFITTDGVGHFIIYVPDISEDQLHAMSIPLSNIHPLDSSYQSYKLIDFAVTSNNRSGYLNRPETMNLGTKIYNKNKHNHSGVVPGGTMVTDITSFQAFQTQSHSNFSSLLDAYNDIHSKEFNSQPTIYRPKLYDALFTYN